MQFRLRIAPAIVLLAASFQARGQNPTGTISGVVADSTAAVIPEVRITVRNTDTGLTRHAVTNATGEFQVPLLPVGFYEVRATLRGFKTAVRSGLKLEVQETLRVPLVLELGEVTETVEVTGEPPRLDTQSSAVGEVITNEQVTSLPLSVRNFIQLSYLSPFAVGATRDMRSSEIDRGAAVPATGGQRPEDNNYQIDGFDNLEGGRHNYAVSAPVDSVAEFRVQAGVAPAEFGRSAGTFINVVTKSGTNEFHGSLYEFLRNDSLDARNFFASRVSPLKRNQFGAAAGGPVVRNKLLAFGNYEAFRQRSAGGPTIGRVPTDQERQGVLAARITDPLNNNQPFPNNTIPASRIDPISRNLLPLWPLPNTGDIPARNFRFDRPSVPENRDSLTFRGDYIATPGDTLYLRFLMNDDETQNPPRFANGIGGRIFNLQARSLGGHYNRVFSPRIVNDFGFGSTYFENDNFNFLSFGADLHTKVGITNVIPAVDPVFTGSPDVSIPGYLALGESTPTNRKTHTFEVTNHLNILRGGHHFKVGGAFRHSETNMRFSSGASGHSFGNRYSGDGFGDYLLGLPSTVNKLGRRTFWDTALPYLALYFQDDWRVTPRLTLNLGLRYEVEGVFRSPRRDQVGFDMRTGELLLSERIADRGYIEDFYRTIRPDVRYRFVPQDYPYDADTNNLAPRVGLAYRVRERLVIRAGFGITYAAPALPQMANANVFTPNDLRGQWTASPSRPLITQPNGTLIPAGWNPEGRGSFESTVAFPTALALNPFIERNLPYGYNQQWTFGVQTQLTPNTILESTYLGSRGVHLISHVNVNFTDPAPGGVQARLPYPTYSRLHTRLGRNNSYYHALGLKLERKLRQGLMLLTSYTWAKSLDTASTFNDSNLWTDPRNQLATSKGPSDFDARHRLVAAYSFELPFGPGRRWGPDWSGAVKLLLAGWGVRGITQFQSGFWYSPSMALGRSNYCAASCVARPDRIADGNLDNAARTLNRYWDPDAFVLPATAAPRAGNAGRSILLGPGINNWDLGIFKGFSIRERLRAELVYEAFNAFNHTQFGTPGASRDASSFGVITGARDPRISQAVLKLMW
jgi:outer membrane receptor protein involved in Fe transport